MGLTKFHSAFRTELIIRKASEESWYFMGFFLLCTFSLLAFVANAIILWNALAYCAIKIHLNKWSKYIFSIHETDDVTKLVQGGQLYLSFPFSMESLVLPIRIPVIIISIPLVLYHCQYGIRHDNKIPWWLEAILDNTNIKTFYIKLGVIIMIMMKPVFKCEIKKNTFLIIPCTNDF